MRRRSRRHGALCAEAAAGGLVVEVVDEDAAVDVVAALAADTVVVEVHQGAVAARSLGLNLPLSGREDR